VQKKVAKFAYHRKYSIWETLAQRRKLAHTCALFKAYTGERTCKAIGHVIRAGSIITGKLGAGSKGQILEKYSFVNRAIQL
jgi:hypothetical protein